MNSMSATLKILCRVIARRMEEEELSDILRDYPRLTPEEKEDVFQEFCRR